MRRPVAADQFYPGSAKALEQMIAGLIDSRPQQPTKAMVAISPHAGYIYSGQLAAKTLASVEIPETVIILGPKHHRYGAPIAVSNEEWQMPFGSVNVDSEVIDLLRTNAPWITIDPAAHEYEHSIEVQIPFLQYLQPRFKIIPMILSHLSYADCNSVAEALASTIKTSQKQVLMVASTDMSHYESRTSASRKDQLAIECIMQLEPEQLYNTIHQNRISMCGVIPVVTAIIAGKILGATTSALIGYTDSGSTTGDSSQVVGYAGLIIS